MLAGREMLGCAASTFKEVHVRAGAQVLSVGVGSLVRYGYVRCLQSSFGRAGCSALAPLRCIRACMSVAAAQHATCLLLE
jgi:hypothetical protein